MYIDCDTLVTHFCSNFCSFEFYVVHITHNVEHRLSWAKASKSTSKDFRGTFARINSHLSNESVFKKRTSKKTIAFVRHERDACLCVGAQLCIGHSWKTFFCKSCSVRVAFSYMQIYLHMCSIVYVESTIVVLRQKSDNGFGRPYCVP